VEILAHSAGVPLVACLLSPIVNGRRPVPAAADRPGGVSAAGEDGRPVVVLKSLDRSLWFYQAQGWDAKIEVTREQLDAEQSRLLMPYVVAESVLAEIDSQGRIAIPKALRTLAEITSSAVLIGLYDRIEVWSPVRWLAYFAGLEERHETVLGKILDLL
jgi:MraZ protein